MQEGPCVNHLVTAGTSSLLLRVPLAACPADPQRLRPFAIYGCVVPPGFIIFLPDGFSDSPIHGGQSSVLSPRFGPLPS